MIHESGNPDEFVFGVLVSFQRDQAIGAYDGTAEKNQVGYGSVCEAKGFGWQEAADGAAAEKYDVGSVGKRALL